MRRRILRTGRRPDGPARPVCKKSRGPDGVRDRGKSETREIDSWYTCTIASCEHACPHASLPGPWPWLLARSAWGLWPLHRQRHKGHTGSVWPLCVPWEGEILEVGRLEHHRVA